MSARVALRSRLIRMAVAFPVKICLSCRENVNAKWTGWLEVLLILPDLLPGPLLGNGISQQWTLDCNEIITLTLSLSFDRRPTQRPTRKPRTQRPTKRPTKRPTSRPTNAENPFREGFKEGKDVAEKIWEDNGSDCGYIFSFQDAVDEE